MRQATTNIRKIISSHKLTLLGVFCVFCLVGYARSNKTDSLSVRIGEVENSINAERKEIAILQKEVEVCEKSLMYISEHVNKANAEISNQISSSSHTIQVWGWIIAVLAIVVTVLMAIIGVRYARYFNRLRKNIALLSSDTKRKYQQIKDVSGKMEETQQKIITQQNNIQITLDTTDDKIKELQELYSDIQMNSQKIYEKLKREETITLLNRLEEIPEDITNIGDSLLARDLEGTDYCKLLNAYHKLINRCTELSGIATVSELRKQNPGFAARERLYAMLFTQHFIDRAIIEPELRELIRPRFQVYFAKCFFMNDAEKCTIGLKKGVSTLDEALQVEIIAEYVLAMTKSHYAKFEELYSTLLSDLTESIIGEIWERISTEKKNAVYLAQYLRKLIEEKTFSTEFLANVDAYIQNAESAKTV